MKATNIIWDTDGKDIDLPTEIEIPDWMTGEDEISDYLSDQTGFCHEGFCLENVQDNIDEECILQFEKDNLRCDICNIGEGICGDFDPSNPLDVPLLRFYVLKKKGNDWEEVEGASYCTELPADTPDETLRKAAQYILQQYESLLRGDCEYSAKELGEKLSELSPESAVLR